MKTLFDVNYICISNVIKEITKMVPLVNWQKQIFQWRIAICHYWFEMKLFL